MLPDVSCMRCGQRWLNANAIGLTVTMAVFLFVLLGCDKSQEPNAPMARSATPVPPDLDSCTRVDIRYEPSTLVYACYDQKSVLTTEELAYLQSLDSFVVVDRDAIKQLGDAVRTAVCDPSREGTHPGRMSINTRVAFRCYKETQLVASFVWHLGHIVCDDGHWFRLVNGGPHLSVLTPQIEPFRSTVSVCDESAQSERPV